MGWFAIDLISILPFDLMVTAGSGQDNVNQFARFSKVSKLYKLIKITRLFRFLKLMKKGNKVTNKISNAPQYERLMFFIVALLLLCHFIGCVWIFAGKTIDDDSWIEGGYEQMGMGELYLTALYFSMTTITTVGYGDISASNTIERIICIFLHIIGVLSYSLAAGQLTSIIENYDATKSQNMAKKATLDRINTEHRLPPRLYFTLLNFIENAENDKNQDELNEFLDSLPFRLKLRTIMAIYEERYMSVKYIREMNNYNFIAWICPLLKPLNVPIDQYIYQESDRITDIYFVVGGWCGFVLPFKQPMVYIEVNKGEFFGEVDITKSAYEANKTFTQMVETSYENGMSNLEREFTVQAIENSSFLTFSLQNL